MRRQQIAGRYLQAPDIVRVCLQLTQLWLSPVSGIKCCSHDEPQVMVLLSEDCGWLRQVLPPTGLWLHFLVSGEECWSLSREQLFARVITRNEHAVWMSALVLGENNVNRLR